MQNIKTHTKTIFGNKKLQLILNIVIAISFIYYLAKLDISKDKIISVFNVPLIISILLAVPMRYAFSYMWYYILRKMGAKNVNLTDLHYVYAKSSMGRYVPGKVVWLIGKVVYGKSLGLSTAVLAVTSTLEIVVQLISATYIGALIMLLSSVDKSINLYTTELIPISLALIITFPVLVFAIPFVTNKLVKIISRTSKKALDGISIDHRTAAGSIIGFSLVWLVSSIPFFVLFFAVVPGASVALSFYAVGAVLISGVIGMIAIFAPGGLGVREGALIFLLSPVISVEQAVLYSILIRIMVIFMDFSFWGITYAAKRLQPKSS